MRLYWKTLWKKHTPDPDQFPFGIRFYDAVQGGGKTLSMVFDAIELKRQYPDMHLITNVHINDFEDMETFETVEELIRLLECSQENKHTLVIIDEALTYFAENGGIDPALMNKITQNRKCRRFVMLATQKFKRVNNRLRDFSLETVRCCHFLNFQINIVRDDTTLHWDKEEMDFIGQKKYTYIFKRNNELYSRFDTFASIHLDTTTHTSTLLPASSTPAEMSAFSTVIRTRNTRFFHK